MMLLLENICIYYKRQFIFIRILTFSVNFHNWHGANRLKIIKYDA